MKKNKTREWNINVRKINRLTRKTIDDHLEKIVVAKHFNKYKKVKRY